MYATTIDAPAVSSAAERAVRDRRRHERYAGRDLAWLKAVRVNHALRVSLVDLSATGAQIEAHAPLHPGTTTSLTLVGPGLEETVSMRVLRCEVAGIARGLVYRGAGSFDREILLPDLDDVEAAGGSPATDMRPPAPAVAPVGWSKMVVRYLDGGLAKGFSQDFHPTRSHFHLSELMGELSGPPIFIPIEQLKAIFFVKDFEGRADYVERRSFAGPLHGRRLEVTFLDGEVLLGATLGFRPQEPGFFMTPADPDGNNLRIYVLRTAVRHIRYLP